MRGKLWVAAAVALAGMAADAGKAWAIPAFARKYEASCQTCHTAYPKLNPFGNAFRLRGYRMPAETEEMIKEEPVSLGVEAYKRVWPDAVWPGDIPGTTPLSVDTRLAITTQHDAAEDDTQTADFQFPEALALILGGTIGETISFFNEVELEPGESEHGESAIEVSLPHAELRFNGPLGSGTAFNLKVGRLVPEASQPFSHGYLLTDSIPVAMFGFNPIGFHGSSEVAGLGHGGHHGGGGTGISVPAAVDGIELYGIAARRFDYSVGVANGIGAGQGLGERNDSKDFFGRVGYKFGGLSLDGEEYQPEEKNWRETSLRVGLFGYRGDGEGPLFEGTGHHAGSFVMDEEFKRVGVDVNLYFKDLNVIAGFVWGEDRLAVFEFPEEEHGEEPDGEHGEEPGGEHGEEPAGEHGEEPGEMPGEDEHGDEHGEPELVLDNLEDFDYRALFVEADYVFYPWLQAAVRYEWLDPSDPRRENFERVTANLTTLIRANVKGLVEYQRDIGGERKDDYLLKGLLRFAF